MTTKNDIREAFGLLEELEKANKRLEKEELLQEATTNEVFKTLAMMAIGPSRYHIRPSEDLKSTSTTRLKIVQSYQRFLTLAEQLSTREITGKKAEKRLNKFLSSLYPVPKKWFTRVLLKNLRIGVAEKTLGKMWGGQAESLGDDVRIEFKKNKCQLAEKLADLQKKKSWKGIDFGEWGWYSEPKLDGDRALLFWFPQEEELVVLTRGGKRWHHIEQCEEFVNRVSALHEKVSPYTGFGQSKPTLYDGEFIARSGSWNETASIVRSRVNFDEERFLSQVRILLWDWCPVSFFNDGIFTMPLKDRKYTLMKAAGLKKKTRNFTPMVTGIYLVGHQVVFDEEEMEKDNARRLDQNFEGTMLKNPEANMVMKRTADVIKLKPTDQGTGTILKCVPGKGKFAAAKKSEFNKVRKEMNKWGKVDDDGYYLHCSYDKPKELIKALRSLVNDSNDRRISSHLDDGTVSYRYSARLGYFVVNTGCAEMT
jgi:ATP-dependent DNA ligase